MPDSSEMCMCWLEICATSVAFCTMQSFVRRKLLARPSMRPISVLLVDDHEVVRVGLQTVLSRQDSISVVGEASTVTDAARRP